MDLNIELEPANYTTMLVAQQDLFAHESPLAALPVAVEVELLREVCRQAKSVAEVSLLYLARILPQFCSALSALHSNFVATSRRGCESLPLAIALIIAACSLVVALPGVEGFAAYGATSCLLAAAVVAVVWAAMLVEVDVLALLALPLMAWNNPAATTCTVDDSGSCISLAFWHTILLSRISIPC